MSHELTPYDQDVEWCRHTFIYADHDEDFEDDVAEYISVLRYEGMTVERARHLAKLKFKDSTHRLIEDFKNVP